VSTLVALLTARRYTAALAGSLALIALGVHLHTPKEPTR
jgi:hypothetical protein